MLLVRHAACTFVVKKETRVPQTVAIVKWSSNDGIAEAIRDELVAQNYQTLYFRFDEPIPSNADVVLTFAPYGEFLQIPRQLARLPRAQRPTFVHWSTENPPNPRLPWVLNRTLALGRSRLEQNPLLFSALHNRMIRYRIMGDYLYAHAQGVLDVFVESSMVFADWYNSHEVPTMFAPWGSVKKWYADLGLERDIDVLWMGQRRTPRRSNLIEQIRSALNAEGYRMYVADGAERPFLYGKQRTELLNRTKITLSLLAAAPYDNIFHYRFRLAAPNRSLLLTEQELPHCPVYQEGIHYVEAHADALIETILHYLKDVNARTQITEQAYILATEQMTLAHSVESIMAAVAKARTG
jgi:hypothetical protein